VSGSTSRGRAVRIGAAVGGVVVLLAVPDLVRLSDLLGLRPFAHGLTIGIAAVGLNILLRHTELVSFGHAAFFGAGGYTTAIVSTYLGVDSFFLMLVLGVLIATVLAMVIGALSLRHTGLYFSLLTLAFGMLLFALVQGNDSFFNGTDGLFVRPGGGVTRPDLLGISLDPVAYDAVTFYVAVGVAVVGLLVMYRIVRSPFGNALDAIGQDRTRARFIGLPVKRYVWGAFVISGVYCGAAGALWGLYSQSVDPATTLYFLVSGDILYSAILGGFGTLVGPLVGGVVFFVFRDLAVITEYDSAVMGTLLIALVYFFPRGIVGSLKDLVARGVGTDPPEPPEPTEGAEAAEAAEGP
jgi:branched-chain amino acid transport system permease protein